MALCNRSQESGLERITQAVTETKSDLDVATSTELKCALIRQLFITYLDEFEDVGAVDGLSSECASLGSNGSKVN